jgi:hypothetical protein
MWLQQGPQMIPLRVLGVRIVSPSCPKLRQAPLYMYSLICYWCSQPRSMFMDEVTLLGKDKSWKGTVLGFSSSYLSQQLGNECLSPGGRGGLGGAQHSIHITICLLIYCLLPALFQAIIISQLDNAIASELVFSTSTLDALKSTRYQNPELSL